MFYRLLGRIFFYFWVLPVVGSILKVIFSSLAKLQLLKLNNPDWNASKILADTIIRSAEKLLFDEAGNSRPTSRSGRPLSEPRYNRVRSN